MAQLALAQADDVSAETLIFFTVSPFVFKTALIQPLASCWIIDSGANTHISNQRDRFITFADQKLQESASTDQVEEFSGYILRMCVSEIKKNGFFAICTN
ncbi:hypothetical protein N7532_009481 [Penicillium argentinense]|uniref:Uncharacterized protein n=1 Tax=Penicillium argentinense TaxID=1131581 RepID=A0A9W9K3I1_9EURO|nr:uncharacterized protein N7532_009481 [Penicillium argentinense]KAJ5090797.1 hypothetical protein N7532_009481 [Penicillium argentinense]